MHEADGLAVQRLTASVELQGTVSVAIIANRLPNGHEHNLLVMPIVLALLSANRLVYLPLSKTMSSRRSDSQGEGENETSEILHLRTPLMGFPMDLRTY